MDRASLSADTPYLVIREPEPDAHGGQVETTTVFLTASECPIRCNMCDLYQHTLQQATPVGAIPRQIDAALRDQPKADWIKLYNSGNFFDPQSIPPVDYQAIASRCAPFRRVIVENHPKFGRQRLQHFRDLIEGRLEVAVGLETVQPRWLSRLGKQMSRDDFDRYARWLSQQQVDLRVFLILGVPGIGPVESLRWARLSVRHAVACGARHVSLIPARSGHGWNGNAQYLPKFSVDALAEVQQCAIDDAAGRAVVTLDLWDIDSASPRFASLQQTNLTQRST